MAKYMITRPWHGVKKGDTVEIEGDVHSALQPNLMPVAEGSTHHGGEEAKTLELPAIPASKK